MKLNLCENIKKLRLEKGLTQEELAEIFGVSAQAVSRWENGVCYPDMELLPVICRFFGTSIDNLLGADEGYEKQKVVKYKEAFREAISVGDVYKCIDISREAVSEFPNNYEMLNQLMYALFISGDDDGNIPEWKENMEKYDEEIIKLGEKIMKYCPDSQIRLEATDRLAFQHCEMGRKEIGRSIYETLPSRAFCKEGCIWWALEENEKLPYLRKDVHHHYELLTNQLWRMLSFNELSNDMSVKICEILEELLRLFDDSIIKDWSQARILCDISKPYFKIGNIKKGFELLKKAAEFASKFDSRPKNSRYNHFLFGEINVNRNDFETDDSRQLKEIMREKWLDDSVFDSIKNTDEYNLIIDSLSSRVY